MSSNAPVAKVVAGGVAGAIVTILVWIVSLFGLTVPAEVAGAAVVIISFAAAYITPGASNGRHTG